MRLDRGVNRVLGQVCQPSPWTAPVGKRLHAAATRTVHEVRRWASPEQVEQIGDGVLGEMLRAHMLGSQAFGVEQRGDCLAGMTPLRVSTSDIDQQSRLAIR